MFVDILATTAGITTILQFFTGAITCRQVIKQGSTGSIPSIFFVAGVLACTLWLGYGLMLGDSVMIMVNLIGTTLHIIYVAVFYKYSADKGPLIKQISVVAAILCAIFSYAAIETDVELARFRIGVLCVVITMLFIAVPLMSLGEVIRSKSTESLPAPMIILGFFVGGQWFLYGILMGDTFMIIPNAVGFALSAFQASLFLIYPSKPKAE